MADFRMALCINGKIETSSEALPAFQPSQVSDLSYVARRR